MDWIFWALFAAFAIHVFEEYVYPGGFPEFMRSSVPRVAPFVTTHFAIVVNGLGLLIAAIAALVGERNLGFSLSVAGLLGLNSLSHIGAAVRRRGYAPGLLSALFLYLPLSTLAFRKFAARGELTRSQAKTSLLLGMSYMAVPLVYFAARAARSR